MNTNTAADNKGKNAAGTKGKNQAKPLPTKTDKNSNVSTGAKEGMPPGNRPAPLNIKRMPMVMGAKKTTGARASNGVKRLLYALFVLAYGKWDAGKAKFTAWGLFKNVFEPGADKAAEKIDDVNERMAFLSTKRMWWVIGVDSKGQTLADANGGFTPLHTLTSAQKDAYVLKTGEGFMTAITSDETKINNASFVKFGALSDYYAPFKTVGSGAGKPGKLEIGPDGKNIPNPTSNPELYIKYNPLNVYQGYCAADESKMAEITNNVRSWYLVNPDQNTEALNPFDECEYVCVYNQPEGKEFHNEALDEEEVAAE